MNVEHGDGPIPPRYHRLLGSKTGIVTNLTLTPPGRGEPQAFVGAANVADLSVLRETTNDIELRTGGKAITPDDVLVRSIGEACERYAVNQPDPSAISTGTYNDTAAAERTVPFEYLNVQVRDADDRPSLPPLTRETSIAWTKGVDLVTESSVKLPAELVWGDVGSVIDVSPRFGWTTSGCAAGERLVDALLGGLFEAIERDAVMRTWLTQRTPAAIDPAEYPAVEALLEGFLPNCRTTAHLFALESPVAVPTVGAAIVDERARRPKFVVGGAAGFDVKTAAFDALAEAAQSWNYVKDRIGFDDPEPVEIGEPIANFDDNVLLYARPENFDRVSFLFEGEPTSMPATTVVSRADLSDEEALAVLVERLHEANCTPICRDITPTDIDEVGIHVIRAVVPELLPLTPPAFPPVEHPSVSGGSPSSLPHPYP